MALPTFIFNDSILSRFQTSWKSQIDPVLSDPLLDNNILTNVVLKSGVNVINHLLQRQPQGWFITDINAAVTVYRSQPFNDLTLTLTASGPATVNLVVY